MDILPILISPLFPIGPSPGDIKPPSIVCSVSHIGDVQHAIGARWVLQAISTYSTTNLKSLHCKVCAMESAFQNSREYVG